MALTILNQLQDQSQSGTLVAHYRAIVSAAAARDQITLTPEQIKHNIRQRVQIALRTARALSPEGCECTIRAHLRALQAYCQSVGKTFIFVEEAIAGDQHGLDGQPEESATLFRGQDEQSTIAICVTNQGALLHLMNGAWISYRRPD